MRLRWNLIITEVILGTLIELAPGSLGVLEVVAQYVVDLSQSPIETCINCCNFNSYAKSFGSEIFFAPTVS
jgi:hypothetical protein